MAHENQSEGRRENAAEPVDQWKSGRGMQGADEKIDKAELPEQRESVESPSFKKKDEDIPRPHDLLGPAGDPAEGKRPGGSAWPA